MADIRINPEQVQNTGGQFNTKRGELDALIAQANSLMTSLQGAWTGQRANKTFGQWAEMQPNLKAASATLEAAGQLLKAAATDFSAADSV